MSIQHRRHWIFDMDGTLTVAVHDFPALARSLGLPPDQPILESIAALPAVQRAWLRRELDRLELRLAEDAVAAEYAARLLSVLSERGASLGIVTRNSHRNAMATLEASGLAGFFLSEAVIGRDEAAPKPSPEGIEALLAAWGGAADETVMVGDFLYDLQAGRAAGVATVHVSTAGDFHWPQHSDLMVRNLSELLPGGM